jgi:hypothetical protein
LANFDLCFRNYNDFLKISECIYVQKGVKVFNKKLYINGVR